MNIFRMRLHRIVILLLLTTVLNVKQRRNEYRSIQPIVAIKNIPSSIESKNIPVRPVIKVENIPPFNDEKQCVVVHSCHIKKEKSYISPASSSQDLQLCKTCTGNSPHEKCRDLYYNGMSHLKKTLKPNKSTSMSCVLMKSEKDVEASLIEETVKIKMEMEIATVTETEINCSFPIIDRCHSSSSRIALLQQLFPYDITNYCVSDESNPLHSFNKPL